MARKNQKLQLRTTLLSLFLITVPLTPAISAPARAAEGLPSYQLQFLGSGSPVAINGSGTAAGSRLVNGSTTSRWSASPGHPGRCCRCPPVRRVFPHRPERQRRHRRCVRMTPDGTRWRCAGHLRVAATPWRRCRACWVRLLPTPAGSTISVRWWARAGTGLHSRHDHRLAVQRPARRGGPVCPVRLGDRTHRAERQRAADRQHRDAQPEHRFAGTVPPGPSNYNPITPKYINNNNQMAGAASLPSQSLNIVSAYRYDPGSGWTFIAGSSKYTTVASLNLRGDVGYGEQGAGLYLDGLGTYALTACWIRGDSRGLDHHGQQRQNQRPAPGGSDRENSLTGESVQRCSPQVAASSRPACR